MTTARATPAAEPPRVWTVFIGFVVVFVVAQVIGLAVVGGLFVAQALGSEGVPDDPAEITRAFVAFAVSPPSLVASAAVSSLSLVSASLIGARLSKTPTSSRLRLGPGKLGWGRTILGAAGVVAVSFVFSSLISLLGLDDIGVLHLFEKAFSKMTPTFFALSVLFIGVTAPIGEELFFRGYMLTRLSARYRRLIAIGISAAAFGLMHMDPVQSVYAFFVGLHLGWLTEVSGSVRAAVAAHAVNNCLAVVTSWVGAGSQSSPATERFFALAYPVAGVILLVTSIFALRSANAGAADVGPRARAA